jgi:hypothetical protein
MKKKLLKYFPNEWHLAFVFVIAIGLCFLIIGRFSFGIRGNEVTLTGASILITLGVGFFSLGFAFLSIGIAKESDDKMKSIADYHLLEVKGIIEDIRLTLQKHLKKLKLAASKKMEYSVMYDEYHSDYSFSMWKVYTKLQELQPLFKYSTSKYQLEIIDLIYLYFKEIKGGRNTAKITLIPEHKDQISKSYNFISKFPVFNQYSKIKELEKIKLNLTK